AATGWVILWLTLAVGGRRRAVIALFGAVAIGASLLGAIEWRRRDRPVAVVIADAAPIRAAPYGGASAAATVQGGGALLVGRDYGPWVEVRSEEHTSELQSRGHLVCRLLLEKKKKRLANLVGTQQQREVDGQRGVLHAC